jgi:hypothetical protein
MARSRGRSTAIFGAKMSCRPGTAAILRTMCACRAIVMPHFVHRPTARAAAATGGDDAMARELVRAGSGRNRRPTVVHGLPEVPVGRGKMLMVPLQ